MYDHPSMKQTPPLVYKSVTTHNQRSQGYEDVVNAGPAAAPIHFPTPSVGQAEHWSGAMILNHRNGQRFCANILVPQLIPSMGASESASGSLLQSTHAFLTKKKLSKSSKGQLRLCILLRPCQAHDRSNRQFVNQWETTDELYVIKSSLLDSGTACRNLSVLCKDPLREVSAQQYLGNYHPHILACHEAFRDDEYVYKVLPYCAGGDLHKCLLQEPTISEADSVSASSSSCAGSTSQNSTSTSSSSSFARVSEKQARKWFCQLLGAVAHLQKKGVCHGGLSLENIFKDKDGNLQLGDFGLSLRIPYNEGSRNMGGAGVTDVSEGSTRRLIRGLISHRISPSKRQNSLYMAPEMCAVPSAKGGECFFDGFSVDLWSLGVALFIMLTGSAPFRVANERDSRFVMISEEGLLHKLACAKHLSPSAVHLLQIMLLADPSKRPSLADILVHPWVKPVRNVQRQTGAAAGSQMGNNTRDPRRGKRRLHHLSFGNYYCLDETSEASDENASSFRPQVLQRNMRMASF